MKPSMNAVLAAIALLSMQNANVQSFTSPNSHLARSSFLPKQFHSHSHSTKTRAILASKDKENDDEDEGDDTWDFDVDYDKENTPNKNTDLGTPNLGINIGTQLEPLSESQAKELRDEATETINAAFDERLDEIANMKDDLRKDFERSKENMRFASDLRAREQTEKLMNKIDQMSGDFLAKNEELRTGTKLAARADINMAGKGMEIGSWGKVRGVNVLTSAAGGMGVGLLGSKSSGDIGMMSTESSIEVDTQVKGDEESRIMVVCDDKDKNLKKVLERFGDLLNDKFPNPVTVDTYNPTSIIPMGGKNAQCAIIVSTSLSNGQSSAEGILGRVLKRTLASGGGRVSTPPTHLVVVSPLGTERIELFPYSMQNMMGGGKLKKAREVEEVAMSTVKGRFVADSSIPSLDYTILKLGEIVDDAKIASKKEGVFEIKPGDSLDGKVGIEAAANALLRSVALQPSARNSTLSVVGAMGKGEVFDEEVWDDWFMRLDGPELWRSDTLVEGDEDLDRKFEALASYMDQWSERFDKGAKGTGLTTPVAVSPSRFLDEVEHPSVVRKYGVRLEFKQTSTGSSYKSKSEEKDLEATTPNESSTSGTANTFRQSKEGGVEIVVEEVTKADKRQLRVRARRCNMDDATVVKEISEETILKRLGEAVGVWKKMQ